VGDLFVRRGEWSESLRDEKKRVRTGLYIERRWVQTQSHLRASEIPIQPQPTLLRCY
jgi:hypothetical protein